MAEIEVVDCGPATTIQDAGRYGLQRYGVGPAGAMDRDALTLANLLVGNDPDEAAIEFAGLGGRFRVKEGVVRIALAGADAPLSVDGEPVAAQTSVTLRAGDAFSIGPARNGMYAMLGIAGGLDVAPMLGSRSLHRRAAIGGLDGKALQAGDILPLRKAAPDGDDLTLPDTFEPARGPIRVLRGPQDDHFSEAGLATFFDSSYTLSRQADRMGYRLNGPVIAHSDGFNIISDGIVTGAIQVPGSGEPIVLMADRQTTGGYPKIATIISADLPRFAQLRPGDSVRFQGVTREEAVTAAREAARLRADLRGRLIPAGSMDLTSERLLALNLVGGMVDARADFFQEENA
ncbi:MAG: biotin-dependent carboxyltransferase family protein [Salinarimonas sp.]|nr:biotin-dependent carboxyltransferase family protein [Salinarimonas sp.]